MNALRGRLRVLGWVILVALLAGGIWLYQAFWGSNTFPDGKDKVFTVSRGQSFGAIVDSLEARGIIRSRSLFVFVSKVTGGTSKILVGRYVFASGISNASIYQSLRTGRGNTLIPVTIPEGLMARVQAKLFFRAVGIDSARYLSLVYDESFAHSLGVDAPSLEGFLFPETYEFYWEPDEKDVIRRQVDLFQKFYTDSLQTRTRELGWTTVQLLAFASIVEGEAVLNDERPVISGVYHNRLRKGMKLDADPTIQYIIANGPRRILYADLQLDSPYNTYLYAGLPPGPVNNPGRSSILAALFPTSHNYLFFVANGKGGHWFTSTYAEHMRHVRMYRRMRAKREAAAAVRLENKKGSGSS